MEGYASYYPVSGIHCQIQVRFMLSQMKLSSLYVQAINITSACRKLFTVTSAYFDIHWEWRNCSYFFHDEVIYLLLLGKYFACNEGLIVALSSLNSSDVLHCRTLSHAIWERTGTPSLPPTPPPLSLSLFVCVCVQSVF